MGSPGADGQTCGRSVIIRNTDILPPKVARKIVDTLRGSLTVNSDELVFKRVIEMECASYQANDPYWQRAVEYDVERFRTKSILPPYIIALYNEHMAAPAK
jgi:hypothetical protein